ncbi:MAG: S9 family peptidase [Alphaproteobacteria bacterium]|nr:S9 family peptidase [Alphaproteobacteria bacterium]
MFKSLLVSSLLATGALLSSAPAAANQETLPLDAFAMMPVIEQASVSRDGKKLAVMRARGKDGGYIIEVFDTDNLGAEPVRLGADKMDMQGFGWITNDKLHVSFRIRKDTDQGGGNYFRYLNAIIDADGQGRWEYLPEAEWGPTQVLSYLPKRPDEVLLSYETDDTWAYNPDVVLYNVRTKKKNVVIKGTSKKGGFGIDWDGEVRTAVEFEPSSGSIKFHAREKGESDWKLVKTITPDSETREDFDFLGFVASDQNKVYVRTNNGQDKAGIYILDIKTGEMSERQFGLKSVDTGGVITSSKSDDFGRLLGFSYTTSKSKAYYLDEQEAALTKALSDLFPGKSVGIASRSDDDNMMILYTSGDRDAGTYYMLRNKSQLNKLGERFPLLTEEHLSDVKYVKYKARDGRSIPAYVTIPDGEGPFPAIVLPHGGPWVRDTDRWDDWSHLLAHHGYVVIRPNYRGSTGYGLDHWKAGDKNWGLTMQDDLDDAAMYLVDKGLATTDKLAIFGWSYGGYAAFAATVRKDSIYQCSLAGAGVSNLDLLNAGLDENPFLRKLQMPTIDGVSPVKHVEDANIPIFVVHGEIDQRVPVVHSRQFVDELKKHDKDYKYSEIDGLDHFYNTFDYEHKVRFYSEMLEWFASDKCFGK